MDRAGRGEIHYAALEGDVHGVRRCLSDGENPSAADGGGRTPLHFAAQGQHAEIVRILARAGATVDSPDAFGNTPLWRAVFESQGRGDTISALLEAGADPDVPNKRGVTPRTLATSIGNYDVVRFLPPE